MAGNGGGATAATLKINVVYDPKLTNLASYVESQLAAADSIAASHRIQIGADTGAMEKSLNRNVKSTMKSAGQTIEKYSPGKMMTTQFTQVGNTIQKNVEQTAEVMKRGSKEYATSTRRAVSAISTGEKKLAKFSKAKYGKTADSWYGYHGEVKNLHGIMGKLDAEELTQPQFNEQFGTIQKNMKMYESEMVAAGEATQTFGSKMNHVFSRLGKYVAASTVIYQGLRAVKEMASASIEVESAMNRIQIVTGASDREMSAFFTTASSQARELGKSITDVASSIETFSRLGYNLKDASELSKFATIMSNVGDTDVDSATTGITSIIKGYGLTPGDAEHVSDVLVTVGKNYAISAEELMTAFERGGAALSASGTDFEKSAALFAATNASLQNAQMTGTMWKTVSARIRGATSELEEMGEDTTGLAEGLSKYRDEIMALSGVDIMKNENEYKDMYTIFTELASVWDNINGDEAKARVAEILGGTRQLSGIMSTIMNIKDAEGAYSDAMNSAGESARANDKYMETTAAHVGQLKATFQEFSSDFLDSSFLRGLVDSGNALLGILDSVIGKFGVIKTVIAGVGLFKLAKKGRANGGGASGLLNWFLNYSGPKKPVTPNYPIWDDIRTGLGVQSAQATGAVGKLTSAFAKFGITSKAAMVGTSAGLAAVTAAIIGGAIAWHRYYNQFDIAQKKADKAIDEHNETKSKLESVNSELQQTQGRIDELNSKGSLSIVEQDELAKLEKQNELLTAQQQLLEDQEEMQAKVASDKAKEALSKKTKEAIGEENSAISRGGSRSPQARFSQKKSVKGTPLDLIEEYNKKIESKEKLLSDLTQESKAAKSKGDRERILSEIDSANEDIAELTKKRNDWVDKAAKDIEAIRAVDPNAKEVVRYDSLLAQITAKTSGEKLDAYFSSRSSIKDYLREAAESGKDLNDALASIGLSISDLGIDNVGELKSYFDDAAKSADNAKSSIDSFRKQVSDIETATESANRDQDWSTVQAAYKTAKEMLDEGKTGTDDFQVMAQFLSPKNLQKSAQKAAKAGGYAADEYQKAFQKAMHTANRWFGDDETKSMENFVNDFKSKGLFDVRTDEMGLWDITTHFKTTADAAKKFGMSVESVETMLDSLEAYGYDFSSITKSGEAFHQYETYLNNLKETYDKMDSGAGKDRVKSLIDSFDKEYAGFKDDLSNLSEDQVVHIKFEYDLAELQAEIDSLTGKAEDSGSSEDWAEALAARRNYVSKAENQLRFDKAGKEAGVKIPAIYEVTEKSVEESRKKLENASEKDRPKILAEISNATQLQQDVLDSISSAHPEITPETSPEKINEALANFDGTITVTADVDQTQIADMLNAAQDATINFTADVNGVERTVSAYIAEDGTIAYKADMGGVETSVSSYKDEDGTVHYKADTSHAKPKKSETTTEGKVNYSTGEIEKPKINPVQGLINWITGSVEKPSTSPITRVINWVKGKSPVNGTAHARGTAFDRGNWGASDSGTALGGELGTELLVRDGRWYTIGDNGAEFFKYKKDDIIFNAAQTEQLFEKGKITYGNTRGRALAEGTAFRLGSNKKKAGSTGKKSGGKKSSKSSKSSKKSKTAMDKFQDWFAKLFDWIEIRLERQAKKIENFTHQAERAAKQGNASAAEKQYKNAISAERTQMYNAAKGAKRYDAQANAVLNKAMKTKNKKGKALLSESAAKTIKARVADGTIDISSYSKNLQEIIKDYQQWYDKARECEDKVKEMSEAIVDTYKEIADTYKETANAHINLLKKQSDNATSAAKKNSYLEQAAKNYDSIVQADQNAIAGLQGEMNSSKSAVTGAGTVAKTKTALKTNYKKGQKVNGKKLTSAQAKKLNAANKATNSANAKKTKEAAAAAEKAKSEAKAGKKISNISALYSYYNSGFLSGSFYEACVRYNQMVDYGPGAIAELQNQLAEDTEEAKAEKIAIGTEMVENVQKEYERKLNALQAKQNLLTTSGYEMQKNDYNDLNAMLTAEKDAIQSAIDRNVALGYWTTSTAEYLDAVNDLSEISESIQENINAIAQLPYDEIEKALDLLDAVADYNKSLSDFRSAAGEDLSASDYEKQMEDNRKKIAEYEKQALQAYKDLQAAEANGGFIYGKTAKEYEVMYYEALSNINSLKESNEELRDDLRDDVYWRTFERAHDAAQRLLEVVSGIASLISDDMYFKNGKLTEFGAAQIANLTKQYELARQEVQNYSSDIANLNRLLAAGEYTNEEYKEKLAELQNGLLDAARDMKSYMSDIMDMYKELDQAQLDALFKLIDARNDALNAKKEYYDYDKTIKSKTKDIQELTAQIAALEGINTAEAKAQRAKLQEQLAEAQEDLEDTERDHYYQMMQDGLSDLKETLQDQFDDKWEYLSQDLARVAGLLESANELSATNAETINKTLTNLLSFYGINAAETGIDAAYASGTRRVNGRKVALSNESGSELIVTKNGLISHFKPGDGVVPADLTARLYDLAQGVKPGSSLGAAKLSGLSGSRGMTVNQNYDSLIHIDGSADAATVSDLKRMSKNLLEMSYDYTSKRIQQDYTRTGGLRRA